MRGCLAPGSWLLGLVLLAAGCATTPREYFDSLKGEGFPGWNEKMAGFRGDEKSAAPSGFFTDRRSEQIEQSLGGGF